MNGANVSNADDLARRLRAPAVKGYDPKKVADLTSGLIGQLRHAQTITVLEMMGVGDGIFTTVALTLLEVAAPGDPREAVRKQIVEVLDRIRRDIETGPGGSPEVM